MTENPTDPTQRAVALHQAASQTTCRQGREWYPLAARFCRRLAREHGISFHRAAGITAALSPATIWAGNQTKARRLLLGEYDDASFQGTVWEPALHIRDGTAPLAALRGPKVRSFYRNIVGGENAITIDRWMVRAMGLPRQPKTEAEYDAARNALCLAACQCGENPRAMQAILWIQVRGSGE